MPDSSLPPGWSLPPLGQAPLATPCPWPGPSSRSFVASPPCPSRTVLGWGGLATNSCPGWGRGRSPHRSAPRSDAPEEPAGTQAPALSSGETQAESSAVFGAVRLMCGREDRLEKPDEAGVGSRTPVHHSGTMGSASRTRGRRMQPSGGCAWESELQSEIAGHFDRS